MTIEFRLYRGLEIYPLVFSRRPAESGRGHNYDEGFDAAVRIQEPGIADGATRSRVFKLDSQGPFKDAGDARRASHAYAEKMIDTCVQTSTLFD
ncbi:conserved hypothetical protein [Burkholderia sp. 8Y]|uniref:hypothetical protein n=1 Tax=Burkholderia sp. 8Y TaxID=2653133 RepID=UPI0012F33BE6|nr:hypothetical protein [Burkholderia sp. 8Y]VXC94531.1 conserved hypothetical protein [Burkholderia sp. 8Y]